MQPIRLNSTERQYQNIFDAGRDGLVVTDLDTGCVVEANPAACTMHGYTREEFIGFQLGTLISPHSQRKFGEAIRRFELREMFETRIMHVCRDGSKQSHSPTAATSSQNPLPPPNGPEKTPPMHDVHGVFVL